MKFYFCETCGKRITEKDLEGGQGKDKKLKGIYCSQCAVGVLTMESAPISESKARAILAQENEGKKPEERRPTSGRLQAARKAAPAEAANPHPSNAHALYVMGGLAAAVVVVGVLLVLKSGGEAPAANPKQAGEKRPSEPLRPPAPSNGKSARPPATGHPLNHAAPEEIPPTATPETVNREALAQTAYETLLKSLADPANDDDERAAAADSFFKTFGDTIAASRARSELSKRKEWRLPLAAESAPQPATGAGAKTPSAIPTALKITFDEERLDTLANGTVEAEPPAGAQGKALKLEKGATGFKASFSAWAVGRNAPKDSKEAKEALYQVAANAQIRFRYYCGTVKRIQVFSHCANDGKSYGTNILEVQNNRWTEITVPVAEMKFNDRFVEPGWLMKSLVINFQTPDADPVYLDDLELFVNEPAAKVAGAPPAEPMKPCPEKPATVEPPSPRLALNLALALAILDGRKEDVSAKLTEGERNQAWATDKSTPAHWRTALGWLQDLEAALPKGVESLKEEDAFELRLTTGAPVQVGRKATYQIQKVESGVLTLAGAGASIPLALDKLSLECRAELTERGLGGDGHGRILRSFHGLRTAYEQKKPFLLDEAALEALAKAGGSEDDLTALRFLALQTGGPVKECAAETAFAALERLAAAKETLRLVKELSAFHQLYDATAFARRNAKELEVLQGQCVFKLTAVADTYVFQNSPTENFGERKEILAKNDGTMTRYAYIRFDLAGLSGKLESAALRLYTLKVQTKPTPSQLEAVADIKWSETGTCFKNKPDAQAKLADFSPVEGKESLIDLTQAVKAAQKDGSLSLRVSVTKYLGPQAAITFASREADEEDRRPTLLVRMVP
ncbi:MAG: DNRLRE domain-containing protein [Planctomycetes bacterium]|nr:DNRLRE domain-containing protein [Planctomycetota bacterium]